MCKSLCGHVSPLIIGKYLGIKWPDKITDNRFNFLFSFFIFFLVTHLPLLRAAAGGIHPAIVKKINL